MRFCICYYGVVGRSLEHTYESIKRNILDVLSAEGISWDTYVHNNEIDILRQQKGGRAKREDR